MQIHHFDIGIRDGVPIASVGTGEMVVIAGPCVIESEEGARRIAARLAEVTRALGLPFIFKASFDKANRTSGASFRGPGLQAGLDILRRIRADIGVPITTDVHQVDQMKAVSECVDLLQIPAFLCRQTDLLTAAGASGLPVNIKKGQFMAPWDMAPAIAKVRSAGGGGVMLTERGSSFGYNNLVVDMRSLPAMSDLGVPVCFDATHSTQLPGGNGLSSGGDRKLAPALARAAVAMGVDAIFLEVHESPDDALSDAATQLPLAQIESLLRSLQAIHQLQIDR
ncbi:MAG: 3-deoxy-8-phosphooctulonate synthase [Myxococcota bacterium]